MKDTIKSLLVYFFIIFFVTSLFKQGIILPTNATYLIGTMLILTLTIMIISPFLNFLTVKSKMPTFFLMGSLLLTGVFFLLKLFMTGFYIQSFEFGGFSLGTLQINSFTVTPIILIVAVSILISLLCSIYKELDDV